MREWIIKQWNDIAGNFKFWLLGLIVILVGAFARKLLTGLLPWQQSILVGVFLLLLIWAFVATWYASKPAATAKKLYAGETKLRMFYPGSGRQPRAVGQQNIFRWNPMRVGVRLPNTAPTDPDVFLMWLVCVTFEEQVDPSAWTFVVGSEVNPNLRWKLEDFSPRGIIFTVEQELPTGVVEMFLERPPAQ